jgi:regulator of protease activity HflC (stomatin/prohibitin superfamily)
VKEAATTYGIAILRADVKDLIFPGNLQEIMNRVLTTERLSQAQLVEARTQAEVQQIETAAAIEAEQARAAALSATARRTAETEAEIERVRTAAQVAALESRAASAKAYTDHPALLRLQELEALRDLGRTANARIYIGFDKHMPIDDAEANRASR